MEKKQDVLGKINPMWIIILLFVGMGLMLYGSFVDKSVASQKSELDNFETRDPSEYADFIERKVKEICSVVEGVGEVKAVVTLSGGYKTMYAFNSQGSSSGYKSELVTTGNGASENALVVGYEYPEIAGIGIVVQGGESPFVKQRIISLVSSAFNISTNKIEVVGG